MSDDPIPRLLPTLRALTDWFAASRTPYLVIGGVAVSVLARARATRDIDAVVMIDEDAWASFLESGSAFGFVPRIPKPLEFARKSRVLLLAHRPEGTGVDISLGAMPFEAECIARGTATRAGGIELRLPQIDDLILMKAVASRPIDLADIDTLLNIHPHIDRRRIRRWVRDFADTLETPEIVERLESLLGVKRTPHRRKKNPPAAS